MNAILKIIVFLTIFSGVLAQDTIERISPAQEIVLSDDSKFLKSLWVSGYWVNQSNNISVTNSWTSSYQFSSETTGTFMGNVSVQIMEQLYLTGNYSSQKSIDWTSTSDYYGTKLKYNHTNNEWGVGVTFLLSGYEPVYLDDPKSIEKPIEHPDTTFRPYVNFSLGMNKLTHTYNLINQTNPYTGGDTHYELEYKSLQISVGSLVHIIGPLNFDLSVGLKKCFFNPTEVSKMMSPWYETFTINEHQFIFKSGITVIL